MSVVVLTGSQRAGSFTRRVARTIAELAPGGRLGPDLAELPFFDQDLESDPPEAVQRLREELRSAAAVVIVTPEYNGAVPGVLANAIDWLSRPYERGALVGKPVIAVTASPGPRGGQRALAALADVLRNIGAQTIAQLAIAAVDTRVTTDGVVGELRGQLRDLVTGAVSVGRRAA